MDDVPNYVQPFLEFTGSRERSASEGCKSAGPGSGDPLPLQFPLPQVAEFLRTAARTSTEVKRRMRVLASGTALIASNLALSTWSKVSTPKLVVGLFLGNAFSLVPG